MKLVKPVPAPKQDLDDEEAALMKALLEMEKLAPLPPVRRRK
ncbi:MAG: hypothetical protein QM831_27635 [Kofleriaceae bacterium]